MSRYRVAVFVDWENLRKEIESIQKNIAAEKLRIPEDIKYKRLIDYNKPEQVIRLIKSFINEDEEIFRIFFYTAKPQPPEDLSTYILTTKDFEEPDKNKFMAFKENAIEWEKFCKIYNISMEFIDKMSTMELTAMRLGELRCHTILANGRPFLQQKQVDMLLGLDISHVSYLKLADRILIFSKDTDMKPALKIARTQGLQTILSSISEGYSIDKTLKKHTDFIRIKSLVALCRSL